MPTVDGGVYWLDGELLWCRTCRSFRHPAPEAAGCRAYVCGPGCPLPPTPAVPAEQDATLAAMTRAQVVLHAIGREAPTPPLHPTPPDPELGLRVTIAEVRRWEACVFTDRRAVLRAAYHRLEIDERGVIHRIWRHHPNPNGGSRS
ncbi:MAG: hypothetical protein ACRDTQ_01710 [Micromonosporaceae bacterium]